MANTIRFKFIPLQSSEVGNLFYDLETIEDFINEELKNYNFGNDVKEFQLSVHTYVFNGPFFEFFNSLKDKKGFKKSNGILFATKDLNYAELKEMDQEQQLEIIKGAILKAIEDVEKIGAKKILAKEVLILYGIIFIFIILCLVWFISQTDICTTETESEIKHALPYVFYSILIIVYPCRFMYLLFLWALKTVKG